MMTWATWLTISGAVLAVLQSMIVVIHIWWNHKKLLKNKAQYEAIHAKLDDLKASLEENPDQPKVRGRMETLRKEMPGGWSVTWNTIDDSATKAIDLRLAEQDLRDIKWLTVPGVLGGSAALVGAILMAQGIVF